MSGVGGRVKGSPWRESGECRCAKNFGERETWEAKESSGELAERTGTVPMYSQKRPTI